MLLTRESPTPQIPKTPRPKRRLLKKILYVLGGLGFVGAGVLVFRLTPVSVDLATLERESMEVAIAEEDKTRVCDRYVNAPPVEGRLQRIDLEAGETGWRKGKLLLALTPCPSMLRCDRARLMWQSYLFYSSPVPIK